MLNEKQERECDKIISCDECMKNAPYHFVASLNVGNMNFVKNVNGLKIHEC